MGFILGEESSRSKRNPWIQTTLGNSITDKQDYDFIEECLEDSCDSLETMSSFETVDDISSSSVSSHDGPLYELSELVANLPIKRGLSKFYHGKSESFRSLTNLKSFEDLAKRSRGSRRSTKSPCRSVQSQTLNPTGKIVKNKRSPLAFIRSSLFCSFEATSMGAL